MKFWIGAAANLATMTVCWAQLYIDGVCYGVHVFVVPLRDPSTHDLLPGVLIGDCGPKNGLNEIDNGFILFNKVRVPVTNLLNRLSGVDANGKFYNTCKNEDARFGLQLGAISGGRIAIAGTAPTMALNALSIAIRYACIRKQFGSPGSP
jgi:acyl-CoA oxidase